MEEKDAEDKQIIDDESYTREAGKEETINMAPNIGYHNSNVSNYCCSPPPNKTHTSCERTNKIFIYLQKL